MQSAFFFIPFFRFLGKGAFNGLYQEQEKDPEILVEKESGSIRPRLDQVSG